MWCKYNVDASNGGVMFVYARLVERHLALNGYRRALVLGTGTADFFFVFGMSVHHGVID